MNKSKVIYSDDLLEIIEKNQKQLLEIKEKYGEDSLINRGLFLMTTTYFEAMIRDLLQKILYCKPEKFKKKEFNINKEELSYCENDSIIKSVIDKELYHLFMGNTKKQLLFLTEMITNIKEGNIQNKQKCKDINEIINKISDISFYRNALIHNAGEKPKNFCDNILYFKPIREFSENFFKNKLLEYLEVYEEYNKLLICKVKSNIEFQKRTKLNRIRNFWKEEMNSPMLDFDSYWEYCEDRDIVTGIKYPIEEGNLSSSEKIILSIWRHQYDHTTPTEEFLICSISQDELYRTYCLFDEVKFYYMMQESSRLD